MRIVITFQHRGDDSYLELINMAFASAKRMGYETVSIGNMDLGANYNINFPTEMEPHLMNWILAAQLAYIVSPLFNQPSVLFSPDALILKPLERVFDKKFDVAFTDRSNIRWPINNGVIYIKPENKNRIGALWREALQVCKNYPVDTQDWYGDQQALYDIYKLGAQDRLGVDVALLPCGTYNATPATPAGYDAQLLKKAYVAHFKGKRKHMMKKYWDYLCTQD